MTRGSQREVPAGGGMGWEEDTSHGEPGVHVQDGGWILCTGILTQEDAAMMVGGQLGGAGGQGRPEALV